MKNNRSEQVKDWGRYVSRKIAHLTNTDGKGQSRLATSHAGQPTVPKNAQILNASAKFLDLQCQIMQSRPLKTSPLNYPSYRMWNYSLHPDHSSLPYLNWLLLHPFQSDNSWVLCIVTAFLSRLSKHRTLPGALPFSIISPTIFSGGKNGLNPTRLVVEHRSIAVLYHSQMLKQTQRLQPLTWVSSYN